MSYARLEFVSMAGCNLAQKIAKSVNSEKGTDIDTETLSGYQLGVTCEESELYLFLNRIDKQFNHIGYAPDGVILYQKKRVRKG